MINYVMREDATNVFFLTWNSSLLCRTWDN